MSGSVDLHTHTVASDGALSPGALVEKAWSHGVRVLAITDHDTTNGLAEAPRRRRLSGADHRARSRDQL